MEEILENTNIELAYAIDSYRLLPTTTDNFMSSEDVYFNQNDYDRLFDFTKKRLSKYGDRSFFIRESSQEALKYVKDGELDLVFIDAEHTYDAVKLDIKTWCLKLKKSGILAGHDYDHPNFSGVKKAVDEFLGNINIKVNIENGYVWWAIIN